MSARIILRIELTPSAKKKLNVTSDRHGMTQVAMLSRLVEWFAGQPPVVQAAVMRCYPGEIEKDVAKIILQRMSEGII